MVSISLDWFSPLIVWTTQDFQKAFHLYWKIIVHKISVVKVIHYRQDWEIGTVRKQT